MARTRRPPGRHLPLHPGADPRPDRAGRALQPARRAGPDAQPLHRRGLPLRLQRHLHPLLPGARLLADVGPRRRLRRHDAGPRQSPAAVRAVLAAARPGARCGLGRAADAARAGAHLLQPPPGHQRPLHAGTEAAGPRLHLRRALRVVRQPGLAIFLAAITFTLFEPIKAAAATLLLVDGRVRQEGLDLLAAVQQLPARGRTRGVQNAALVFLCFVLGGTAARAAAPRRRCHVRSFANAWSRWRSNASTEARA